MTFVKSSTLPSVSKMSIPNWNPPPQTPSVRNFPRNTLLIIKPILQHGFEHIQLRVQILRHTFIQFF